MFDRRKPKVSLYVVSTQFTYLVTIPQRTMVCKACEANCSINDLDPRQALDLLQGLTKLNLNVFACLAEIADDTMKETIKKFTLVTPDLLEKKMNLTATKEERLELAKEYWTIFIERENTTYM